MGPHQQGCLAHGWYMVETWLVLAYGAGAGLKQERVPAKQQSVPAKQQRAPAKLQSPPAIHAYRALTSAGLHQRDAVEGRKLGAQVVNASLALRARGHVRMLVHDSMSARVSAVSMHARVRACLRVRAWRRIRTLGVPLKSPHSFQHMKRSHTTALAPAPSCTHTCTCM